MSERGPAAPRPEPKFWTVERDTERLYYETIDEAVDGWASNQSPGEPLPVTVEVYGFAPMPLPRPERFSGRALEIILEYLDEEHGDPDGKATEPTPAMREAELTFIRAVLSEYKSWACEEVECRTVNVKEYYDGD